MALPIIKDAPIASTFVVPRRILADSKQIPNFDESNTIGFRTPNRAFERFGIMFSGIQRPEPVSPAATKREVRRFMDHKAEFEEERLKYELAAKAHAKQYATAFKTTERPFVPYGADQAEYTRFLDDLAIYTAKQYIKQDKWIYNTPRPLSEGQLFKPVQRTKSSSDFKDVEGGQSCVSNLSKQWFPTMMGSIWTWKDYACLEYPFGKSDSSTSIRKKDQVEADIEAVPNHVVNLKPRKNKEKNDNQESPNHVVILKPRKKLETKEFMNDSGILKETTAEFKIKASHDRHVTFIGV